MKHSFKIILIATGLLGLCASHAAERTIADFPTVTGAEIDPAADTLLLRDDSAVNPQGRQMTFAELMNVAGIFAGGPNSIPAARTINRSEVLPQQMTWKRVGASREWFVLDERQLHFVSSWEHNLKGPFYELMDGLSTVHDTAISVAATGNATITATGTLQLVGASTMPKGPWASVELTIESQTGVDGCGPAIVKDANNYIAFRYDGSEGKYKLIEVYGGTTRTATSIAYTPTFPLKLTVSLTGNTVTGWVGNKLIAAHTGGSQGDYRDPAIWKNYRYGMAAINATTVCSKMRAGASGVTGAENILPVTYLDGSPYMLDGKLVATADCSQAGTLESWNTAIWTIDLETAEVEVIGRIYFKSTFPATRWAGGNFVRLLWDDAEGRFLTTLISFDGWGQGGIGPANGFDLFGYSDINLRGETIVDTTGWSTLGLTSTSLGYGVNPWKTGDTWHAIYSSRETGGDVDVPNDYTDIRPTYYTGPSLDDLTLVWRDNTAPHSEGGSRLRLNGLDYFNYTSDDVIWPFATYAASSSTRLGNLKNIARYTDVPGYDAREAWAMWVSLPNSQGTTSYYALGNTKDVPAGTIATQAGDSQALATSFSDPINRGSLTVWKADQKSRGREFPVRNANRDIIFPADTFVTPAASLATGLKLALPLTADAADTSPYTYDMSTSGTVTHTSNGAQMAATSAIWCREPGIAPVTGDFTYSIQAKYDSTALDGVYFVAGLRVRIEVASGQVLAYTYNGSTWQSIAVAITSPTAANHYAVRYTGGILSIWKNGVKATEAARTVDTTDGWVSIGGGLTYAGWPATPTVYNSVLQCRLKNAKFWNRALSDIEMAADYNGGTVWMP